MADLKPTKLIIPKLWKGMKVSSQHTGHVVIHHWQDIVGENIAKNVVPVRFEKGSLFLTASSSAWSNEIMLMKLDIIDKINRYVKEYAVKKLVFQGNSVSFSSSQKKAAGSSQSDSEVDINSLGLSKVELKPADMADINASCRNIQNLELRSKVERSLMDMKKLMELHSKAGWHRCQLCGELINPRYKMCLSCENKTRSQHRRELREYLRFVPWATYADVCSELSKDMEDSEYIECKKELIQEMAGKLKFSDQDTADASVLAMLHTGCTPDRLTKDVIYKAFKRLRYDLADASDFFDKKRKEKSGSMQNRNIEK